MQRCYINLEIDISSLQDQFDQILQSSKYIGKLFYHIQQTKQITNAYMHICIYAYAYSLYFTDIQTNLKISRVAFAQNFANFFRLFPV